MGAKQRAAAAYGRWNRERKLAFALAFMRTHGLRSVLLVGVYPDHEDHVNQVERGLAEAADVAVACGILSADRSGWDTYVTADARSLPFEDRSFDLVYSNAVIEHVGGEDDQRRFVEEHSRVGRAWIMTTPNRLFPIEAHYHTLFAHSRRGWSRGDVTRLLSRRDLRELVPADAEILGTDLHPTLAATRLVP